MHARSSVGTVGSSCLSLSGLSLFFILNSIQTSKSSSEKINVKSFVPV